MASRIKDEFVASVSHELRTPLTSIIGYVDVILDDTENLPEDARSYLLVVQRNARRLHRLVDDLLSTALQSVATVLDIERVSVTELLERSAVEARKAAAAAGLELELDTTRAGSELDINGDSERLAQVFDNLFSNAIKYTPAGGRVEGTVGRDGDVAVVRVRDTGRGIAEAEQSKIFNKFFRGSTVLTDAIPGVGLGLAITKTIVDAHGGSITVSSELGKGATFEVRLPARRAAARPRRLTCGGSLPGCQSARGTMTPCPCTATKPSCCARTSWQRPTASSRCSPASTASSVRSPRAYAAPRRASAPGSSRSPTSTCSSPWAATST